ncbi:MAG: hypothetical protein ABIA63_12725, partial [bacterium]
TKNPGSCGYCKGSGKCSFCYGKGKRVEGTSKRSYEVECNFCGGTGKCTYCLGKGKCKYCEGTGHIKTWNWFDSMNTTTSNDFGNILKNDSQTQAPSSK